MDKDTSFGRVAKAWPENFFQGDSIDGHWVGDEGSDNGQPCLRRDDKRMS